MHPSKRLGDRTEREAVALLHDLFGYDVKRELGAGRAEDCGDLSGMPDLTVQIFGGDSHLGARLIHKPLEVERQRINRGTTFAVTMIRMRGGAWRFVLTPEQFSTLYREATASLPICWACKKVISGMPCIGEDGEEYHTECCSVCVEGDE